MDRTVTVIDAAAPGKKRDQRWHYPSRSECLTCHNPWAGYTLAFNVPQLNRNHDYHGIVDNQLRTLVHLDLVTFLQRDWNNGKEKIVPKLPTERLADLWSSPQARAVYGDSPPRQLARIARGRPHLHTARPFVPEKVARAATDAVARTAHGRTFYEVQEVDMCTLFMPSDRIIVSLLPTR